MHTNFPGTKKHQLARIIMGAFLIIGTAAARAEYVVVNDDLLPTAMVEARRNQHVRPSTEKHSVLFARGRSPLIEMGRETLDALIPQIGDGVVRIVGRTDGRRYATIPRKRANNMRDYLIRRGISPQRIVVEIDNTPIAQNDRTFYASEVHITRKTLAAPAYASGLPTLQAQHTSTQMEPAHYGAKHESSAAFVMLQDVRPQPASAPTSAHAGTGARDEKLMIYIAESVKSGKMDPAVAVRMLEHLAIAQPNKGTALSTIIEKSVPNDYQVFTDANVDIETPIHFDTKIFWLDSLTKGAATAGIEVTINMTKKIIRLSRTTLHPIKPNPTSANRISYAQTYTGK